jgi:hypothetical protein
MRDIPYKWATRVYGLLHRAVRRAGRIASIVSIAGAKALIDVVLTRDHPKISFERLFYSRYNVFLLVALTRVGPVGCSFRDALLAYKWMPIRDILWNVQINWRTPTDSILLSENTHGPNILHINRQYYSLPPSKHRFFAPYFAHPVFYKAELHKAVLAMRERDRNVKIFFAGTRSDSAYSKNFSFPILSRDKILRHLIEKFELAIKADADKNGVKSILLVTSDTGGIVEKHKLSIQDYIATMSRSDFFICPPGHMMPHSHNLIEAMSVGTIPITNYASYMRPPLTPDVNCLAFSTLEELDIAVNCALQMPAGEVQRLREGVISYYNEHVEPGSFGKKVIERLASILEVVVNDESGR